MPIKAQILIKYYLLQKFVIFFSFSANSSLKHQGYLFGYSVGKYLESYFVSLLVQSLELLGVQLLLLFFGFGDEVIQG